MCSSTELSFDAEKLLSAIIANSQSSKCPLELVLLNDCWCLRCINSKSWTLTAGAKGEPRKDACQRIMMKIASQAKKKNSMMFYQSKIGISPFKSFSQIIMEMTIKGLY